MRRSGSSSCLLRPRDSMGELDASENNNEPFSVTVMSREKLPTYSTERYYMLSEFHLNTHSVKFLSELRPASESSTPQTVDTSVSIEETFSTESSTDSFPPFMILYILWRPDMPQSVHEFTSDTIVGLVEHIQSHVDVRLNEEKQKTRAGGDSNSPKQQRSDSDGDSLSFRTSESASLSSLDNAKTRLYLVVDRITPVTIALANNAEEAAAERERHFQVETNLAERLARHVSRHPQLRSLFEGMLVGVANHERAAPGLEACLDAITVGAMDRRRVDSEARCLVGIIAWTSADLIGLDHAREADAVQGILQTRITTEWNGKGNLKSFAARAHNLWRKDRGLPAVDTEFSADAKQLKRRNSRDDNNMDQLDAFPLDGFINLGAFLILAYYVWNGIIMQALNSTADNSDER